jgi:spermidine/putrescine transport system substrate-binding protein
MLFHYNDDTRWDWRFTYCRKSGSNEETTDSKRYTFLLGPGQSCRTAADNFMALYEKRETLEITDIEDAFNVEALSKEFFDRKKPENYYQRGVSPYIRRIFETKEIGGENWSKYAAGYMWGITGLVYNPALVPQEDVSTWNILTNPAYHRRITIKDNVRDAYFAAVGALKSEKLVSEKFRKNPEYPLLLEQEMNDTSKKTVGDVQEYLQAVRDNVYSFETDSGKSDMITGKIAVNYQWSGDAVYAIDQAEDNGVKLNFSVPKEATNIYFDGWCMLKSGIGNDSRKQRAAEAFINFVSRPDNAVRNMYYIGYTSVISGGENPLIFEYLKDNYEAEPEEKDTVSYDVNYFFSENGKGDYKLTVPEEQTRRQLAAQYPDEEMIGRSSLMIYFNPGQSRVINRMWVNVRCFNIRKATVPEWLLMGIFAAGICWLAFRRIRGLLSK